MGKDTHRKEYLLHLDGSELKSQRRLIDSFIAVEKELVSLFEDPDIPKTLLGLQNLLDALADQAHDVYGIDCLLDDPDDA